LLIEKHLHTKQVALRATGGSMFIINRMLAENGTEAEFDVARNSTTTETAGSSKRRYLTAELYEITTQNT
jgi:hypothetical protein